MRRGRSVQRRIQNKMRKLIDDGGAAMEAQAKP